MSLPGERPRSAFVMIVRATLVAALAALAGCQVVPTAPPAIAPPVPPHAVFTPTAYADLPGWSDDRVEAVWPAFLVGCTALVARPRTQALWQAPCAAADAIDERDAAAVRHFFEANFTPYRVTASDGS
ncbi:MAG TPA: hypothetical protein VKU81_04960, partial [Casimicrobiaceae bacterium]|nr:hypothetical protein [Casimicrobiaceae bacterium]